MERNHQFQLRAPLCQPDGVTSDGATEKYHGLLKIDNDGYRCQMCPRDNELRFDDDEEALNHITGSHLEMGYGCTCGRYVDTISRNDSGICTHEACNSGETYWSSRNLKRHERSLR